MKKIFALCVICLFAAAVCQADDSKFNVKKEAETPSGNACACSNVRIPVIKEEMDLNQKLAEVDEIPEENLTEEDKDALKKAHELQEEVRQLTAKKLRTPAAATPGSVVQNYPEWAWYYYKDGSPMQSCNEFWAEHKDLMTKLNKILKKNSKTKK